MYQNAVTWVVRKMAIVFSWLTTVTCNGRRFQHHWRLPLFVEIPAGAGSRARRRISKGRPAAPINFIGTSLVKHGTPQFQACLGRSLLPKRRAPQPGRTRIRTPPRHPVALRALPPCLLPRPLPGAGLHSLERLRRPTRRARCSRGGRGPGSTRVPAGRIARYPRTDRGSRCRWIGWPARAPGCRSDGTCRLDRGPRRPGRIGDQWRAGAGGTSRRSWGARRPRSPGPPGR